MKIKSRARPALPPVAPGVYVAVCVQSIDLGEQAGKDRNGKTYYSNKVRLGFELAGETVEIDGKREPRILGRTFPVARAKNAGLRKFVESWRGKVFSDEEFGEFDTNSLVGVPCQISVILNDTGEYANIDTVMQLPKGYPPPTATAPLIRYDMEPWNEEAFKALPEWAQEQIKKSTQYQKDHPPTEAIDFPAVQTAAPASPVPSPAAVTPSAAVTNPAPAAVPASAPAAVPAASPASAAPGAGAGAGAPQPINFAEYAQEDAPPAGEEERCPF